MMAAALLDIAHDLSMGASATQLSFSIFVLGLAFGPLLIAPLSEVFGRKPVWLGSNIFYLCWNALCPVGESKVLLIIARFLAGFGASSGITVSLVPFTSNFCSITVLKKIKNNGTDHLRLV
jgi:MFS family permease